MLIGTPSYMPPEQASGETERIGIWSDIYSLGVVFYRLITGRLPFEGPTHALIFKIVFHTPPPPSRFRTDLDPSLDPIVLKAMARQPQGRYQSALEFTEALEVWLRGTSQVDNRYQAADRIRAREEQGSLEKTADAPQPTDLSPEAIRRPETQIHSEL